MIFVLVIALGLVVAGINVWQRLGRSPAARSWSRGTGRPFVVRNVLVLWPLFAVALVCAGGVGLADGTPAAVPFALGLIAALLLWLAWAVLPLPIPSFVMPRWYAELPGRPERRPRRA